MDTSQKIRRTIKVFRKIDESYEEKEKFNSYQKNKLKLLLDILEDFNVERKNFKNNYIRILKKHINY